MQIAKYHTIANLNRFTFISSFPILLSITNYKLLITNYLKIEHFRNF